MGWNNGQRSTEMCVRFDDEQGGHGFIGVEDPERIDTPIDVELFVDRWYVFRLEYRDNQFRYYVDDQRVKTYTPTTPVEPEAKPTLHFDFSQAKSFTLDIDEIVLR